MTVRLPAFFDRYRGDIDGELRSVVDGDASPLFAMMRYHMGWADAEGRPSANPGGKALRPTLCLLSCEAAGGEPKRALPAAAALELVHNFSLIHDDIQDDDSERHHMPTVWSIWGKAQAINAGTAMRMLAGLSLRRLGGNGASAETRLRAQELLDETTLALVQGQYLDISFEKRLDVKTAEYLEMIAGKTAALIACSAEMGALIASCDRRKIAGMREVGRNLGMMFQVRDDILGIWGREEDTGKPSASDIRKRKKGLPVIYALEKAAPGPRKRLCDIYVKPSIGDEDVSSVLEILDGLGCRRGAQAMAEGYCSASRQGISKLGLEPRLRDDFEDLFEFLLNREF